MMTRIITSILFVTLLASTIAGPTTAEWSNCLPRHVVVIGIDGLGSHYLETDFVGLAPKLADMFAHGSSTMNARAATPVLSLPNWASLMLGETPEHTGIGSNHISPFFKQHMKQFTSIYELANKQGIQTGLFTDWKNIEEVVNKADVDHVQEKNDARSITRDFNQYLGQLSDSRKSLSFVHIDLVDHAGHSKGYGSDAYYEAISKADKLVASIVESSGHLDPFIVVVSDHGGIGKSHGQNGVPTPEEVRVPVIMYGSDILKSDLQNGNMVDSAATIVAALDLVHPSSWSGHSQFASVRKCSIKSHGAAQKGDTIIASDESIESSAENVLNSLIASFGSAAVGVSLMF